MNDGTVLVSPFAALLRNRQFVAAIVGALVTLLINVVPMFEPARQQLSDTVLVLFGLAIGGFSVVDTATAFGEAQVKAYAAKSQLVTAQTVQSAQAAGMPLSQNVRPSDIHRG